MKHIIEATNLVKSFGRSGDGTNVLAGVSVRIGAGEFVAVMGPSGCGKTTLLFSLSGTDDVNSGSVRFADTDLASLDDNRLADLRRTRMGFVFQQPTMLKNLNVLDNILLPGLRERRRDVAGAVDRARALMKKTGIEGLEDRDITQVSGGQLQRAGICRALMNRPDVLFADEPTGALNSRSADGILELLCGANREGTAIFLVTHDAKVAARAHRVLFMKDGGIVSELPLGRETEDSPERRTESVLARMRETDI